MRRIHGMLIFSAIILAGCGQKQAAARAPAMDTTAGMGGMRMSLQATAMMPLMQAHLDSVRGMDPARMAAMMPAHQSVASRMMGAMGTDMHGMNVAPNASWSALSDSVRQDLARLSGLTGAPLGTLMQEHIGRMQRMMAMYQGMMRM